MTALYYKMNDKKRKFFSLSKSLLPESPTQHFTKRQKHSQESSDESLKLSELGKSITFTNQTNEPVKEEVKTHQSKKIEVPQKFDGTGVFINRVKYYKDQTPNMISFRQIFMKDPNNEDKAINCEHVIFTTFEYEQEQIQELIDTKIPVTLFEDKIKSMTNNKDVFQEFKGLNMNKINMTRFVHGQVPFASYHSKLFLCEFDDRLRVLVTSANLTVYSWQDISQVIWAQDFPKTQQPKDCEFKSYLSSFIKQMIPKVVHDKQHIFRKPFDINQYDFTHANASLVGSVNGRFHGDEKNLYGSKRFASLMTNKLRVVLGDKSKIWVQASSIGKIWPRFLQEFYFDLTGSLVSQERIHTRFGFIYPTERFVRDAHGGILECGCLHLKSTTWNQVNFPRGSFYRLQGKTADLDRVVSHSKMIVVTHDDSGTIDDNTLIYFGSHNFSTNAWGKEEK